MKKLAIAVAMVLGVVGAADAAMLCKNSIGQEIRYQKGFPKPELLKNDSGDSFKDEPKAFDVSKDVLCYVSHWTYLRAIDMGLPAVTGISTAPGAEVGLIYRGDMAKFLLENLPAYDGNPATKQDAFDRKP